MADARVWIGCLACYNDGRLTGRWVELDENEIIDASTVGGEHAVCTREDFGSIHEEFWVMDHEGVGERSEFGVDTAIEIARGFDLVEENLHEAFLAYCDNVYETPSEESAESFLDAFVCIAESQVDYAMEFANEIGALDQELSWPYDCIDWSHAARELFLGGSLTAIDISEGVLIISS
jgi:Antirestriction protein (ArdA)